MIFVTLGSQKFQFDRLLKEIDDLYEKGVIKEPVFAQSGACTYKPKHFQCVDFIDREEFEQRMNECDLLISHGGSGAIICGLKNKKKVIAVPRKCKYGEHVDDHQEQIVEAFAHKHLIYGCKDVNDLEEALKKINDMQFEEYISHTEEFINHIREYIEESK